MIKEQKNSLDQGYVWVPIVSRYSSKNIIRRKKINKIFNLGLDIKDDYKPSKSQLIENKLMNLIFGRN